jgi:hypothetical protein
MPPAAILADGLRAEEASVGFPEEGVHGDQPGARNGWLTF